MFKRERCGRLPVWITLIAASVLPGAATVALPGALCVLFIKTYSGFDLEGNIDNAPLRAAGVVLFVALPVSFVLSTAYFAGLSVLSRRRSHLRLSALSVAAIAVGAAASSYFAFVDDAPSHGASLL